MNKKIFISYSSQDRDYAQNLAEQLKKKGFDADMDFDLQPGENFVKSIKKTMDEASHVIVLVSDNWVDSSFANFELGAALGADKKITPVIISKMKEPIPNIVNQFVVLDATKGGYNIVLDKLGKTLDKK